MEYNGSQPNVSLSAMRCPTCGSKIKYKAGDEQVMCMSCGNVYNVEELKNSNREEPANAKIGEAGALKVVGIKTSTSALAYLEQFFDSYNWDAFALGDDTTIYELEKMAEDLKVTSSDDYRTWVVCFEVAVVPFAKKLSALERFYDSIIADYKKGNLDSYGAYDLYKSVSEEMIFSLDSLKERAKQYLKYGEKYGLPKAEEADLESQLATLNTQKLSSTLFNSVEEIPEIKEFDAACQDALLYELRSKGIDAPTQYSAAQALINEEKYAEALKLLHPLKGYSDVDEIIERINERTVISSQLFINEGRIYYRQNDNIYRIDSGNPKPELYIRGVRTIVANYANILYFFDADEKLRGVNLFDRNVVFKSNCAFDTKQIHFREGASKAYFVKKDTELTKAICELDFRTNEMQTAVGGIQTIRSAIGQYVHFVISQRNGEETKTVNCIFDLESEEQYEVGAFDFDAETYFDDKVLYTINNPENYNKNLFLYDFKTKESRLLERNIYGDCRAIEGKIYYFSLDNLGYQHLISINADGTDRKELSSYVSKILFTSGDWMYFVRSNRYNTALCKMKLDGSEPQTIAAQILEFIRFDGGYLYYIDDDHDLCKVLMNGARKEVLCSDVTNVLKVDEDIVVYLANDRKDIKSIYAIDLKNGGHKKVCYNVLEAKLYGSDIYYVNAATVSYKNQDGVEVKGEQRYLNKLNLETNQETKICELDVTEKKQGCYVATCVYNSYDCPEVWRLRRYRDDYLDLHWWGRAFIKIYYAISPKLVKRFGQKSWFRDPVKRILDKKVSKLEKQGFSDAPYHDKY